MKPSFVISERQISSCPSPPFLLLIKYKYFPSGEKQACDSHIFELTFLPKLYSFVQPFSSEYCLMYKSQPPIELTLSQAVYTYILPSAETVIAPSLYSVLKGNELTDCSLIS